MLVVRLQFLATAIITSLAFLQSAEAFDDRQNTRPKAITDLSGLSGDQLRSIDDDTAPFADGFTADPVLVKLLARVQKLSLETMQRAAASDPITLDDCVSAPTSQRGKILMQTARVRWILPLRDGKSTATRPAAWLLVGQTKRESQNDWLAIVARSVPGAWLDNRVIDQPVVITSFFWRLAELEQLGLPDKVDAFVADADNKKLPVLVANRPQWFPDHASAEPKVPHAWVELASAGFDAAFLDSIRARISQPLKPSDTGPFHQLMRSVQKLDPTKSDQTADSPWTLNDLLERPKDSIGQRVRISGFVRQCARIEPETLIGENPGSGRQPNGYYQLTLFPDLQGQRIVIKTGPQQSTAYPRVAVTACVATLPDGATQSSLIGRKIAVDGFHYRFWQYPSRFAELESVSGQVGPLVVANSFRLLPAAPQTVGSWPIVMLLTAITALVLLGLWSSRLVLQRSARSAARPDRLPDFESIEDSV